MTHVVKVTPRVATGDVDELGRPVTVPGDARTYRGRLVVQTTPEYQPVVDGHVTALYRLFLPAGAVVEADAVVECGGRTFTPVAALTVESTPVTGLGYATVTVKDVS